MENIKQFDIVILNNHKCVFCPGQLIQGQVILETLAPMMIQGKMYKCSWSVAEPGGLTGPVLYAWSRTFLTLVHNSTFFYVRMAFEQFGLEPRYLPHALSFVKNAVR